MIKKVTKEKDTIKNAQFLEVLLIMKLEANIKISKRMNAKATEALYFRI